MALAESSQTRLTTFMVFIVSVLLLFLDSSFRYYVVYFKSTVIYGCLLDRIPLDTVSSFCRRLLSCEQFELNAWYATVATHKQQAFLLPFFLMSLTLKIGQDWSLFGLENTNKIVTSDAHVDASGKETTTTAQREKEKEKLSHPFLSERPSRRRRNQSK